MAEFHYPMYTIEEVSYSPKNFQVTFVCRDLETEALNPAFKDKNYVPRYKQIEYDLKKGEDFENLIKSIRLHIPSVDLTNLEEAINSFAALSICEGKQFPVYWSSQNKQFYFATYNPFKKKG